MSAVPFTLAFAGGFLTILSPCILPILPLLLGTSLRSHRFGPVALVAGLIGGFALAGSLLGITVSWFAGAASILRNLAICVLFVMGILALFPSLSNRVFGRFGIGGDTSKATGLWGEFWIGSQLGLVWTPCAGPVLGTILTLAAIEHDALSAFGLLVVYGLGAGIPMLLVAYGSRSLSQKLQSLRSKSEIIQRIGGAVVAVTALAILFGWDTQVQLWLAPFFPQIIV
jgi:cytochrome c-type biogenesis protein